MTLAAGTRVLIHYTGTLDDGTQFDSSRGREPLEVVLGRNMVIPGFEKAIAAMKPGQTVTVRIPEDFIFYFLIYIVFNKICKISNSNWFIFFKSFENIFY